LNPSQVALDGRGIPAYPRQAVLPALPAQEAQQN